MSGIVIKAEVLGKRYLIGHQQQREPYVALRDVLTNGVKKWWSRLVNPECSAAGNLEEFWALQDVNFEIRQGERVGIIGRNGAGKSTLLKVLSRIVEPTTGKVKIKGRVASLLEVGTGFHPELTGRENIFLNGAILGMSRQEIKKKFDEIVSFAEVEKFLDTPVKRYSSGMYVRLAFAVAAHLEPEILIVDEVLAVGDAQFQKKCLGKMEEVGREGRTILFVSHNMGAVKKLCSQAIMLTDGRILDIGEVGSVVDQYLSYGQETDKASAIFWEENEAPSCNEIALLSVRAIGPEQKVYSIYDATKPIDVEIRFKVKKSLRGMRVIMSILTGEGVVAFASTNHALISEDALSPGIYNTSCTIPADLLNYGVYFVNIHIGLPGVKVLIQGREYLSLTIEGSGAHGSLYHERWIGVVAPKLSWKVNCIDK